MRSATDDRSGDALTRFFEFGPFRLDPAKRLLLREGETLPLTPKAFETLLILVENGGELVTKDALMSRLWPDTFVEEGSLTRNISVLRKVLGEGPRDHSYIMTVPGQGYRFVAGIREVLTEGDDVTLRERTRTSISVTEEDLETLDPSAIEVLKDLATGVGARGSNLPLTQLSDIPKVGISGWLSRNRKLAFATGAAILLAVVVGALIGALGLKTSPEESTAAGLPGELEIAALTHTGNVAVAGMAAISRDGKYAAYSVTSKARSNSLVLRQLTTHSTTALVPTGEVEFGGVGFSPDGNYVYYAMRDLRAGSKQALYRIPLLGGPPQKLVEDVDSGVSFSPDGKRMVFRRRSPARRESSLLVANADGSDVRYVATLRSPENFGEPAWSPDGKVIACAAGHADGGFNRYVVEVTVDDWKMKPVSDRRWRWVGSMAWVSDGSGLLMIASDHHASPYRIWRLSYPGGEAKRITSNTSTYNRLSVTADSRMILASQVDMSTNVWIVDGQRPSDVRPVTFGSGGFRGDMSWTPDGRIVFESTTANYSDLSIMDADGRNQRPLLGAMIESGVALSPSVSADGRYVVFASDVKGARNIWRINIDGTDPIQLTHGTSEDDPQISPDGRWVVYDRRGEIPTLWKVSIDGGEAVQLTDVSSIYPAYSPDGKFIASFYRDDFEDTSWRIAVFSAEGGPPVRVYSQPTRYVTRVRWSRDGAYITYADTIDGLSNIWLQPVNGGAPRQLTSFVTDRIFGFEWSFDGSKLACVRGIWKTDLVLIKLKQRT